MALPSLLKKGKPADFTSLKQWHITESGKNQLVAGFGRAHLQAKVVRMLENGPLSHQAMIEEDVSSSTLKTLQDKGWIEAVHTQPKKTSWPPNIENSQLRPQLNEEQAIAVATINNHQGFGCYLVDGVTGSGKTEVYLNLIKPVLDKGKQALVLVPEIGLTPQTINRFKRRFNVPVEVMHSALNDTERLNAWLSARDKQAGIIIGTRSALIYSICRSRYHHCR